MKEIITFLRKSDCYPFQSSLRRKEDKLHVDGKIRTASYIYLNKKLYLCSKTAIDCNYYTFKTIKVLWIC